MVIQFDFVDIGTGGPLSINGEGNVVSEHFLRIVEGSSGSAWLGPVAAYTVAVIAETLLR